MTNFHTTLEIMHLLKVLKREGILERVFEPVTMQDITPLDEEFGYKYHDYIIDADQSDGLPTGVREYKVYQEKTNSNDLNHMGIFWVYDFDHDDTTEVVVMHKID